MEFVFFSAEQLGMPDGIVCVASTTPKRERGHDHQLAADTRKLSHHNKTIRYDISDHEQDHAEPRTAENTWWIAPANYIVVCVVII